MSEGRGSKLTFYPGWAGMPYFLIWVPNNFLTNYVNDRKQDNSK